MIGIINIGLLYRQIASYFIFNYFNMEVGTNEVCILNDEIIILDKLCNFYSEITIDNGIAIDIKGYIKTWKFSPKYVGDEKEAKDIALKMINDFINIKDGYNIYSRGYYYDN